MPRYGHGVGTGLDITIRNDHGAVVGRISRGTDGQLVVEVHDEQSRWLVELAAARAGAPPRPRPRPSCGLPDDGAGGPGTVT
jgi:hypothetical protein